MRAKRTTLARAGIILSEILRFQNGAKGVLFDVYRWA
jgi:hypothetical protein